MSRYPAPFLPFLALAMLAAPATAQTPLLEVDYNNTTVFHVLSNGRFLMPIGAANGYILTSDAQGLAQWRPPPAGSFALPFAGTHSTSGDAFSVTVDNVTAGSAGVFENVNAGNGEPPLVARTNSIVGTALAVEATGSSLNAALTVSSTGRAADFDGEVQVMSGTDGLVVSSAGVPSTTNASNAKNGVEVQGAQAHGLFVGYAGGNGVHIDSTRFTGNGVEVVSAGRVGVLVRSATRGVIVESAGNPSMTNDTPLVTGFKVQGVQGTGLYIGHADGTGVYVESALGRAGWFGGDVVVTGNLSKGSGSFKIDHPLDPEGKYLSHSFVESPDMMNVYNGTVTLDDQGQAVVELPEYFEALNRDFRYQLTAIGAPGPNLYIAEKITRNRFTIAGGTPGLEVSWQVTGIRQDPYAEQNRVVVEEDKPSEEQGYYLHPEAYGQPAERGISHAERVAHRPDEEQR